MQAGTIKTRDVARLLGEAKQLHAETDELCAEIEHKATSAVWKAWQIGQRLNAIKPMVGHGNWLLWLEGNWPELSERTAQRFMAINESSPDAESVADLGIDAVRKFRLSFVPEKDRPEMEGDRGLPKFSHHLTVRNTFEKWQRQAELGQTKTDREELKRDFKPMFAWLCDLFGIEATPE